MVHRLAFLVFLANACAAQEPAKSPVETEAESSVSETPTNEGGNASESKQAENSAPSSPASADDLRDVLQAVIDDEALAPYLHLDQPDRFPLRISGRDVPHDLELTKATKPVEIVGDPNKDQKKPLLVFTDIEIKGGEANVRYRYDVEGIRGSATLNKPHGRWSLKRSRISER